MKIMVKHSHPPIWRRFIVPAGLTFSQLGYILNEVMGWYGGHLSQFDFYHLGIVVEENPEDMDWYDREVLDATDTPIEPFMDEEDWFTYIYDFGDYWEHRVEIEKILPEYELDYPAVLKFKGNTPYEDCGGIEEYYHILEVLGNPEDKEYEEIKNQVDEFPHHEYTLEEVNQTLTAYPLSEKTHPPMSGREIFDSIKNGEPLYTITCGDDSPGRTEASLEEWKLLYEAAAKLKELKPWEQFWDMDLIALHEGDSIVFASILGKGGECYGISIYEDMEGFNDFMMICHQKSLRVTQEYIAMSQNNLTCYWGNRDDLSKEQYQTIKSLGYKFRGKNQWPFFISHRTGYFPYNMDQAEVQRMTVYLTQLFQAIKYYNKNMVPVDFENENLFFYTRDEHTGEWSGAQKRMPFTSYIYLEPEFENEKNLTRELRALPRADYGIDIDVGCVSSPVNDDRYERPGALRILMLADTDSGLMLGADLISPGETEADVVIDYVLGKIFDSGRPREIRVCNNIIAHYLSDLCKMGNIRLKKVRRVPIFQVFLRGLKQI